MSSRAQTGRVVSTPETAVAEQTFLGERFWPGVTVALALAETERFARVARELRDSGKRVMYIRASLIPGDETLLVWFNGPTASGVAEIAEQAGVLFDRISLAIDLPDPVATPPGVEDPAA
jgi:hypothetical protein